MNILKEKYTCYFNKEYFKPEVEMKKLEYPTISGIKKLEYPSHKLEWKNYAGCSRCTLQFVLLRSNNGKIKIL